VHRALEIGAVLGVAIAQRHQLAFCTFTMRHHRGQSLEELWDAARKAWQRSISGKGWTTGRARGVVGWVRVWEVTYGMNGWHVHVHLVLVLRESATAEDLDLIAGGMFDRWSAGLQDAGLDAPLRIAQDWHLVRGEQASHDLGGYLSKLADSAEPSSDGLGLELTHGLAGRAASGLATRPTWAILDHLVRTGESQAMRLWHEWERVSKGKRQVGWSKGLRQQFAPEIEELSDDEIVDQEVGTDADDLVRWTAMQWREMVRVPARIAELLSYADSVGIEAVCSALDAWGIGYERVRGSNEHGQEADDVEDRQDEGRLRGHPGLPRAAACGGHESHGRRAVR
jgi:hypothetical protein